MTSEGADILLPQLGFVLALKTFDKAKVYEKKINDMNNCFIRWSWFDGGFVMGFSDNISHRWSLKVTPITDEDLLELLSEEEKMTLLFNLELL